MFTRRTTTTVALAGVVALTAAACGGGEEDDNQSTDQSSTSSDTGAGTDTDTETAGTDAGAEATATEESGDTGGENAAGIPELADVWPDVEKNANEATSLTATMSGPMGAGETMEATLNGYLDDSSYEMEAKMGEGVINVRVVQDETFMKGDKAFWDSQGGGQVSEMFADQWLLADGEMSGMADSFKMSAIWEQFFSGVPDQDLATENAVNESVEGIDAIRYTIKGQDADVWVTAEEPYQFVKLEAKDPESSEVINITVNEWNTEPDIQAPEDAQSIEEMMGGASTGGTGGDNG